MVKRFGSADYQSFMNRADPRMVELAYIEERIGDVSQVVEQSQPLAGTVFTEQGAMDVADAIVAYNVGTVIHRFGTWVVTEDGIACLVRHYPLSRARLGEHENWASHLAEQTWANLWDVVRALVVEAQRGARSPEPGSHTDGTHPS